MKQNKSLVAKTTKNNLREVSREITALKCLQKMKMLEMAVERGSSLSISYLQIRKLRKITEKHDFTETTNDNEADRVILNCFLQAAQCNSSMQQLYTIVQYNRSMYLLYETIKICFKLDPQKLKCGRLPYCFLQTTEKTPEMFFQHWIKTMFKILHDKCLF